MERRSTHPISSELNEWNDLMKNFNWEEAKLFIDKINNENFFKENSSGIMNPFLNSYRLNTRVSKKLIELIEKINKIFSTPDRLVVVMESLLYANFRLTLDIMDKYPNFCNNLVKDQNFIVKNFANNKHGAVDIFKTNCANLRKFYSDSAIQIAIENLMKVIEPNNIENLCGSLGIAADNIFEAFTRMPEFFVTKILLYNDKNNQNFWDKAIEQECWDLVNYILNLDFNKSIWLNEIKNLIKTNLVYINDKKQYTIWYILDKYYKDPNFYSKKLLIDTLINLIKFIGPNENVNIHSSLGVLTSINGKLAYEKIIKHLDMELFGDLPIKIRVLGINEDDISAYGYLTGTTVNDFIDIYEDKDLKYIHDMYKIVPIREGKYKNFSFEIPLARQPDIVPKLHIRS